MGLFFDEWEDHEGYVANESTIVNDLMPERGHWLGHSGPEHRGTYTGRHRAECSCGWQGLVVVAGTDEWGDVSQADNDQIMLAWAWAHMAPLMSVDSNQAFDSRPARTAGSVAE